MLMVFIISVQDSSNVSNFDSCIINTSIMVKSSDVAKLVINNKYLVSIKACNPYTN